MEPNELTILGLCDVLQQTLIENEMKDLPVYIVVEYNGRAYPLVEGGVTTRGGKVILGDSA